MGHGGKRIGAGRPLKIAIHERWSVGLRCEELRRGCIGTPQERLHRDKVREIKSAEHQEAEAAFNRLDQRRKRFADINKEDGTRRLTSVPWDLKNLYAEIDKKGRLHQIVYLSNASRAEIISEVAKETGHTKRMVTRCWVECRAMLKRLKNRIPGGKSPLA